MALVLFLFLSSLMLVSGLSNGTSLSLPSEYDSLSPAALFSNPNDTTNLFILMTPGYNQKGQSYILKVNVETMSVVNSGPITLTPGYTICGFYQPGSSRIVIAATRYGVGGIVTIIDSQSLKEVQGCGLKTQYAFCEYSSYSPGILNGNDVYFSLFPPASTTATSFLHLSLSTCSVDETLYTISVNGSSDWQYVFGFVDDVSGAAVAYMFQNKNASLATLQIDSPNHVFRATQFREVQYFGVVGLSPMPTSISPPSLMFVAQNPTPGQINVFSINLLTQTNSYTFSIPKSWQIAQALVMAKDSFFVVTEEMGDGYGYLNQFSLDGTYQEQIIDHATTRYIALGNYIVFFGLDPNSLLRYNIN